ncbi:hypothetical protein OH76DRAFT_1365665, partial [Lentinus brumalis]
PTWVKDGYDELTRVDHGPHFARAVGWWATLERSYKWQSSRSGLGTHGRPPAIRHWLQINRRDYHKRPPIDNEEEFSKSWWVWWTSLQPEWRQLDARGRPVMNDTVADDWEPLTRPGLNGLLIVLLSLLWWKEIATQATEPDWDQAARDVSWVVMHMARAFMYVQFMFLVSFG